jgi:hypothetical protein
MKTLSDILKKLFSVIIVILLVFLVAELLFVLRHGYLFRMEDVFSFFRGH